MGSHTTVDFVVIGGGINGASVARELAIRGQSIVVLEKSDIGSGTSSQSSKLIHGGLRYLEQFRFGLVKEALKERGLLLKHASDFVWELPILLPVYRSDKRSLWQIKWGLSVYDWLAGRLKIKPFRQLSVSEILELEPGLEKHGLMGGFLYYDAMTDDLRLCRAVAKEAAAFGAKILAHHTVTSIQQEGNKIRVMAQTQNETLKTVIARQVINCTGPWMDVFHRDLNMDIPVLLSPSKGIHIVVPRCHQSTALIATHPIDGRRYFVLPWYKGTSLIGTTETPFLGNPDHVVASEEEILYLLDGINGLFPQLNLAPSCVQSTFAGIRPLAKTEGVVGAASREVQIQCFNQRYWTVVGGKYTTFRAIGEQVAKAVLDKTTFERADSTHLPIVSGFR